MVMWDQQGHTQYWNGMDDDGMLGFWMVEDRLTGLMFCLKTVPLSSSSVVVSPTTLTFWAPSLRRRTTVICLRAAAGQTAPPADVARHNGATCRRENMTGILSKKCSGGLTDTLDKTAK